MPKLNFNSLLAKTKEIENNTNKKDPIINNTLSLDRDIGFEDESSSQDTTSSRIYSSPSLDILESDGKTKKNKLDDSDIKTSSTLLENVFLDFNIEIKVINVKLGPVVTLFEILPAAGIKINTIINLADDLSRSMGVGAVRSSQIYGTQFLGVESHTQRETVTIKELFSDNNFKNTLLKIPFV